MEREILKTYGPPRLQVIFAMWSGQSATTYPVSGQRPWPRWRSARPGPHKTPGVKAPFFKPGFQNTGRLSGHLASTSRKQHRLSRFANAPPISSSRRRGAGIEGLFAPQHGPSDACELVCQCDDDGVLVRPRQKRAQLCAKRRLTLGNYRENSPGAVDQQLAQIAISALGNPSQTRLSPCRDLPRHEAEPSGQISSARERLVFTDRRGESRRV